MLLQTQLKSNTEEVVNTNIFTIGFFKFQGLLNELW